MAIEAFLGTKAQKAFLFTVCLQAIILLTMVGIVYGNVLYSVLPPLTSLTIAISTCDYDYRSMITSIIPQRQASHRAG